MVLLGALFLGSWSRTWIGVGACRGHWWLLIATGVAGVSLFLYVSFTDILRAQIETISKAGLSTIYSGRSVQIRDAYQHRLTVARKIDLIGYGLSSFRQDYLEHFVEWSRRAQIRILLIDPLSAAKSPLIYPHLNAQTRPTTIRTENGQQLAVYMFVDRDRAPRRLRCRRQGCGLPRRTQDETFPRLRARLKACPPTGASLSISASKRGGMSDASSLRA